MKKQWQMLKPDEDAVNRMSSRLDCSLPTAKILVNRNILTEKDARRFLKPSLKRLRPPFALAGMNAAVERLTSAIEERQKILIFGDYDVDGVTATAVLLEFLRHTGADVSYYIPHRITEGYSLRPQHITDYAVPNRIDLIITADCGSGSHEAVQAARSAGIDVVITDHHKISDNIPAAVSVINPNRSDCSAGFENLAGVGVAFCLLICLRKRLREMNYWQRTQEPNLKKLCDLVAIGTVADIVPLVDDNRIFTASGLAVMQSGKRRGLQALLHRSATDPLTIDSRDIAFRLAPRLNAAGRMDHAGAAVELLTTRQPQSAARIADALDRLNQQRQHVEQMMLQDIFKTLKKNFLPDKRSIVLAHPDWHEGVLGIVASRILQEYFRPVVLVSVRDGIGKGSARSIPGFDVFKGLSACSHLLTNFGGHSLAAGLSLKADRIDTFQQQFERVVAAATTTADFSPTLNIDCELDFNDISPALLDELELLKPYGNANPEPLFIARNVIVSDAAIVGKKHRRMRLGQPHSEHRNQFGAIHFNIDPDAHLQEHFEKIAFRLHWNRWNGRKTIQLVIEETV